MIEFGIEAFRNRRRIALVVGLLIVIAVPAPFLLSWLDSLGTQPIKNFTGIPIAWHSMSTIKIRYRRITKIPITYIKSSRIPVAYHSLSVIKISYRNGSDNLDFDDPRFPIVRLRNTTFRVQPRWMR